MYIAKMGSGENAIQLIGKRKPGINGKIVLHLLLSDYN
jgi:hypothetical protein